MFYSYNPKLCELYAKLCARSLSKGYACFLQYEITTFCFSAFNIFVYPVGPAELSFNISEYKYLTDSEGF
jgi:hypothetical protein